jgi:tRNA(fMet)-specific endonuclease VapC
MYLLDTNACIRILNNRSTALVNRLKGHRPKDIFLCSVVKAELIYGAYHSSRPAENLRVLEKFFSPFVSLPFDDRCSNDYGRIRSDLAKLGTPIGPNDLMIAATTFSNKLTLVTANTKEFGRVIGLSIENWEIEG